MVSYKLQVLDLKLMVLKKVLKSAVDESVNPLQTKYTKGYIL